MKLVKESINDLFKPKEHSDLLKDLKTLSQQDKDLYLSRECHYGNIEVIKLLIDAGANVNGKINPDSKEGAPLIAACSRGSKENIEIIKLLLDSGADINIRNGGPLKVACSHNDYNAVKLLIDSGANVNTRNDKKTLNPLQTACMYDYIAIVKLLLDSGFKPTEKDVSFAKEFNKKTAQLINMYVNR